MIESLVTTAGSSLFLSAHLDDAVLSCGALIEALAGRCKPVVATIFTESDPPPHTLAARSFLRQCAAGSAAALFVTRRREDDTALRGIGAELVHMGYPDALFRRRRTGPAERAGRLLPEFAHRYPTYRLDIARGRVARTDQPMIDRIAGEVAELARKVGAERIFCPLGVGRHVDHVIARTVGERFADNVVFYSDFPYNQVHRPEPGFLARHDLRAASWASGLAGKQKFIRDYASQIGGLFPGDHIPAAPEIYYARTF